MADVKPIAPIMGRPLQAVSEPVLSEDGKFIEQIATQTIRVSQAQLLAHRANLQKQMDAIDAQLSMFPTKSVETTG